MATVTGTNLLDSVLASTGATMSNAAKLVTAARLQEMIDAGFDTGLNIALVLSAASSDIKAAVPELADLATTVETAQTTIETGVADLTINDVSVTEGADGTATATFTVTLSKAPGSGETVTVGYASADDTATAGTDYDAVTGTLTFAEGETSKTIEVTVNGDILDEGDETFNVVLSNVSGSIDGEDVVINDTTGVGTIVNDDAFEGETFTLSKAVDDEVHNGTAESDFFNATELGSLQDGDLVLDNTTTDTDILTAAVNRDDVAARIQNVETINVEGEYVKTGLDLTNVSGTNELNLSTKIAGGVATVTAANSLNVAKINAGTNISTLDITSLTSGTRDEVLVDAGDATTLNLTGAAAGVDSYNASVADGARVTLATIDSAGDSVTLNAEGELELQSIQGAAATPMTQNLGLVVNATDDLEVTLVQGTGGAAGNLIAKEVDLTGNGDITLVSTDGQDLAGAGAIATNYNGVEVAATNTGKSTIAIDSLDVTNVDFSKAAVDVITLTGGTAGAAAITGVGGIFLNENTTLNLAADLGAALTVDVDNGDKDTVFTTGAAIMTVSEALASGTSSIVTGTTVDTLIISAEADEVTDYDQDENGHDEVGSMYVDDVVLSAAVTGGVGTAIDTATDVMVIQGTEDLTFGNITVMNYGQVISASNFVGDLTIAGVTDTDVGATANAAKFVTVVGGKGNDSITTGAAAKFDVQAMAGSNYINVATAAAGTKVTTGDGSDFIVSSTAATTIKAGGGNDTVVAAGNDTLTLGEGSDTVRIADALGSAVGAVTVKDFVKGTDTVRLNGGTAAADIRLDNLDVTDGVYTVAGTTAGAGVWDIALENGGTKHSDKDMTDSIQVFGVTLADDSANVLGDKDDSVDLAAGDGATVTLGGGDDSVEIVAGADNTGGTHTANAVIQDFVVGEDMVIATGTIATDTSVNLKNVDSVLGVYTIGASATGASFKLENGGSDIVTDNNLESAVQLGKAGAAFVVTNSALAAAATDSTITVSGGVFNDVVKLVATQNTATNANSAVFNFKDNGGVDTVIMANNNVVSGAGGVDNGDGTLVNFSQITGIDTLTDPANTKIDVAGNDAKIADAKDGAVYVFADSSDGADTAEITTFLTHTANGYTQDVINNEIAAFIDAGLGVQDGENYVVVINDESSIAYQAEAFGGADAGQTLYESYAYLVNGDADGVQADDITLIGMIDDGVAGIVANTYNVTALDIA